MSVRENMAFGLELRKTPKPEIKRRVDEAAKMLGLDELLERKPKALSGGQRQRVAMGRAIVRQPAVFLFDEPLSNLDAKLRVQMRVEIANLHRRVGATMVYVTHDQVEAMTLADRIAVMSMGELQQFAGPMEVYLRPKNKFVAGFIGSPAMNFVDGTLADIGGRLVFQAPSISFALAPEHAARITAVPGKVGRVTLGFRPQHMHAGGQDVVGQGRVMHIELMGAEIFAHIELGPNLVVARLPADHLLAVGDTLELGVDAPKVHVFDEPGTNLTLDPNAGPIGASHA
jgi:multiple sugar transport system ATP-binding protein